MDVSDVNAISRRNTGNCGVTEVRTKTVALLKRLYRQRSVGQKLRVIAVLNDATRTSHVGAPDERTVAMLVQNTVGVLGFYEGADKHRATATVRGELNRTHTGYITTLRVRH